MDNIQLSDEAIRDAVLFASQESEAAPWVTPEAIAEVLGKSVESIIDTLRTLANTGILSGTYTWGSRSPHLVPGLNDYVVGFDKTQPLFRILP